MTSPRLEEFSHVRRRRGLRRLKDVPVLPSLVTLGNLFFGFLAIAKIADALRLTAPGTPFAEVVGYFELAAVLVFVAMVFDALDGQVARMTGQSTPFGAQLDSMADMVTFGVAPAFLGKVLVDWHTQIDANNVLKGYPKLFYAAAAVYVLCAALRLARFNVETGADEEDHRQFKGLPSPAAAAAVCALVAFFCTRDDRGAGIGHMLLDREDFRWIVVAMPFVLVLLGVLMVSRVPFPHAMHAIVKGRHSMPFLTGLVVVIAIAAIEWQFALVVCTLGYVLTGIAIGTWRLVLRRRDPDDDDDSDGDPMPARVQPSRN